MATLTTGDIRMCIACGIDKKLVEFHRKGAASLNRCVVCKICEFNNIRVSLPPRTKQKKREVGASSKKKCPRCGHAKKEDDFYQDKNLNFSCYCKECCIEKSRLRKEEAKRDRPKRGKNTGNIKWSPSEYRKHIGILTENNYNASGEYSGLTKEITHSHLECGEEWQEAPITFLKNLKCPFCYLPDEMISRSKSQREFEKQIQESGRGEYVVVGKYKSMREKVHLKHLKCGEKYLASPSSFLYRGTRCPSCNETKGEKRVAEVLLSKGLTYLPQYKIAQCKNKRPLPFDFAVIVGKSIALIEYDGAQHFRSVEFFGGDITFERQQRNDRIKTEYCRVNGIPLIRIKYTQFNEIETILTRELTRLGVINSSDIGNRLNDAV